MVVCSCIRLRTANNGPVLRFAHKGFLFAQGRVVGAQWLIERRGNCADEISRGHAETDWE